MPRLVDLSQEIYTGMMVYPGHLKTVLFEHATHEETAPRFDSGFSFQTKGFLLNDNGPTHVDSFSHLDPDPEAQTIDRMDLDLFYGPAICVDVSDVHARTDITADHLDDALAASGLTLERGDMLFLYTATFDRHKGTDKYLTDFPGLGASGADPRRRTRRVTLWRSRIRIGLARRWTSCARDSRHSSSERYRRRCASAL